MDLHGSANFVHHSIHSFRNLSSSSAVWSLAPLPRRGAHLACSNEESTSQTANSESNLQLDPSFMVLQEQTGDGVIRKYKVDKYQQLGIDEISTEDPPSIRSSSWESGRLSLSNNIVQLLRDFILPTDFPQSVSSDYLQYMLLQFPTNVTGWICSTLVTSSLLKAVGFEAWAGSTVAATAAIKWVSKDGLGAFGRFFIGGRFGRVFDDDPKQWRMYAEIVGSFGGVFELITPVKPEFFLPLAALGRFTKAIAKGLKDPSFRVIQTHFAVAENMGEVSAKEEVWEVSAELLGIAIGVSLLSSPSVSTSYPTLVVIWSIIRGFHLWLRYQSLSSLVFSTINFKRAFILAESHVLNRPTPGILSCNMRENILLPWQFTKPYFHLGCSLKDAMNDSISMLEVKEIFDLFSDEQHVLLLSDNSSHKVDMHFIFKKGASNFTVLRCIWQAEWIMNSITSMSSSSISFASTITTPKWTAQRRKSLLDYSLLELRNRFDDFLLELEQEGWNTSSLVVKVPKSAPFLSLSISSEKV